MPEIKILDQDTINKIAAGEVIDRPASVVKELLENSIDAKASAVTVEIKDGGISLIRITDNGCAFYKEQIPTAFLRHSTSKIRTIEDLATVSSLGFRGEALSSIAAVSQVELITKPAGVLNGFRYQIEGGVEKSLEEIGAPEGTTFIVRNLFYNTPARRKFLKSPMTEGGYIAEAVEKLALSHPEISVRFIINGQIKLHTIGNNNLKDIIYNIYGRDITSALLPVDFTSNNVSVSGFIGKPVISRGTRSYENYFINGRYIKSNIISKAIEEGYHGHMMQHRFPFTVLHIQIEPELIDVNVHPAKMELRFRNGEELYQNITDAVNQALSGKELIPNVGADEKNEGQNQKILTKTIKKVPEIFEVKRTEAEEQSRKEEVKAEQIKTEEIKTEQQPSSPFMVKEEINYDAKMTAAQHSEQQQPRQSSSRQQQQLQQQQLSLFDSDKFLSDAGVKKHRIIGQLFDTYWLVEFEDKLFIIDQHAAHEKVLYERMIKSLSSKIYTSQQISPPIIVTLSMQEEEYLRDNLKYFKEIGFEIEHFGGREYSISAVPDNLYGLVQKDLFIEMLDSLNADRHTNSNMILDKIASMSCKAAVKGRHRLSFSEAKELINELLTLDNPYNCPHGRPTIISMDKYEIEKKFKRII